MRNSGGTSLLRTASDTTRAKPYFSILIVVRNRWRELSRCLDCIASQRTPPPSEIIVIDDGSDVPLPFDLAQKIESMGGQIQHQIWLGIAAARNRGIGLARGEFILFVDSDCLLANDCLCELETATRSYATDLAFQLSLSSSDSTLVEKIEGTRLRAVQESLRLESGHILYANTSGFAVRASFAPQGDNWFDLPAVRGSDTAFLANLLRREMKPRFVSSSKVQHSPQMSFIRYAAKQYHVGFHARYARILLKQCGVLMGWRHRGCMAGRMWTALGKDEKRIPILAAASVCYLVEQIGRAASAAFACPTKPHLILSVRVNPVRRQQLMAIIADAAQRKTGLWISYVNAWSLVQAQRSKALRYFLATTDLCYPDGVGVGLSSLLLQGRWMPKVTAEVFLIPLCQELVNRGLSIALVGGKKDTVTKAARSLRKQIPGLRITLTASGYFSLEQEQALISKLRESQPDIILVGMGQPRQEEWVARTRFFLPGAVFWCVGGLFDYLVGPRTSADLARRLSMEWLQRLYHSPRTMYRRYIFGIPALFGHIFVAHCRDLLQFFPTKNHREESLVRTNLENLQARVSTAVETRHESLTAADPVPK